MSQNKFPPGWDEGRVQRLLDHYEAQTEGEAIAEDETSLETPELSTGANFLKRT